MTFESAALLLAWLMIALLALGMAGMLRQLRILTATRGVGSGAVGMGPPRGSELPVDLSEIEPGRAHLLFFASDTCPICHELLPGLEAVAKAYPAWRFLAVFSDGIVAEPLSHVSVLTEKGQLFRDLQVPITPFVIALNQQGTVIAAEPIGSRQGFEDFWERSLERSGGSR